MYYEQLRPIRKSKGYSGTEVGRILGISKQMVHAWEKGVKKISLENLIKLADLYGVSLDELVGRTPPMSVDLKPVLLRDDIYIDGKPIEEIMLKKIRELLMPYFEDQHSSKPAIKNEEKTSL